ncbi:MAG TPA: hypothetical protein VFU15_04655 [Bacteroidia bacterium]|nr:hypothetical protein [Bacteroidia bacterium]
MAVYRFRITFEDNDEVYREIDILGKQTFDALHRAIQEAIGFDDSKPASFFMSDDYWRKGQELALFVKKNDDDDDDDYPSRKKSAPKEMSKSKVVEYIDDPHQKIVYVFDPEVKWTLYLELVKILNDDPKINYPKCTKSAGAAPKQYKQKIAPPPVDEEEEDDEEDKKSKERVFTAEVTYEETEQLGSSEGEEESHGEGGDEEQQAEGEEEGSEESDFSSSFGSDNEDF